MGKSKAGTTKKGKTADKSKETATPKARLRRSARKATPSAKQAETGSVSPAKKANPSTKPSAATKTVRNRRTSPFKKVASVTAPRATRTESLSTKKSATPAPNHIAGASPRARGRPRKNTTANANTSKPEKQKWVTKVARTRARSSELSTDEQALSVKGDWTDSPKKRTPSKPNSRTSADKRESSKDAESNDNGHYERQRQGSVGGIRKSIEETSEEQTAKGRTKSTDKSSVPKVAGRSPSKSPMKTRVRSTSRQSAPDTRQSRSRSPAKAASRKPSKALAKSPSRQTRSASARSRSRSKSPIKAAAQKSPRSLSRSPALTSAKSPQPQSSRGPSKSPGVQSQFGPVRVEKTRAARSPSKRQRRSPNRAKQGSPGKRGTDTASKTRSVSPTKIPSRSGTKSPEVTSCSPSRAPDSGKKTFQARLAGRDDYGKALRRIESSAYNSKKHGRVFNGHSTEVEEEDVERAIEHGIERAGLETGLRSIADNREQRVREGYDGRTSYIPGRKGRPPGGRRPSFYEERK